MDLAVVSHRWVMTWTPDGWPAGLITGYPIERMFVVEHVVVFPGASRGALVEMLTAGLEEAWRRDFQEVVFWVPRTFRLAAALIRVAGGLGFQEYAQPAECERWFVCHRRAA